jgi:hypothetical protein
MRLNSDILLEVLLALPRNEAEKCQLVCKNWMDTISSLKEQLPVRKLYALEYWPLPEPHWAVSQDKNTWYGETQPINMNDSKNMKMLKYCIFDQFPRQKSFYLSDEELKVLQNLIIVIG